jgi:hypothetical protein
LHPVYLAAKHCAAGPNPPQKRGLRNDGPAKARVGTQAFILTRGCSLTSSKRALYGQKIARVVAYHRLLSLIVGCDGKRRNAPTLRTGKIARPPRSMREERNQRLADEPTAAAVTSLRIERPLDLAIVELQKNRLGWLLWHEND